MWREVQYVFCLLLCNSMKFSDNVNFFKNLIRVKENGGWERSLFFIGQNM